MNTERHQMDNQIYRLEDGQGHTLEFWIVDTNDLNPTRDIKELGLTVYNKEGMQLDFDLEESSIKSLMNYLENAHDHIERFNKESKPETKK